MKKILPILCIVLIGICPLAFSQAVESQKVEFSKIKLEIDKHPIQVEVAKSEAERQQGLMFRKSMAQNNGMLFIFDEPAYACMWMKNTLIPLSVAFIDHAGRIMNIEDMKPQTTDSHCGKGPVWYALEMNQGWFMKNNIQPGAKINGLP